MDQEDVSLPPLISGVSHNPRKRPRQPRLSSSLSVNSSDPAVFSSDDDPALDNYVEGRQKKKYIGSWFKHDPASSSDSTFGEATVLLGPKPKRTFRRDFDSGVFLGSDSTDSEGVPEVLDIPAKPKLPLVAAPKISPTEQKLRDRIERCLETGDEAIDFWQMDLCELSDDTIAPLSQFALIPKITKDVAFEQKEPELKLYLAQNRLMRLPGALFDVTYLTTLSLRNNKLTEVPPAIGKMRNLQQLNLSQNRIRSFPVELLDLFKANSRLEGLSLFPNPLLPAEQSFESLLDDVGAEPFEVWDGAPWKTTENLPRFLTRRLGRSPVQTSESTGKITSVFTTKKLAMDASSVPVEHFFNTKHESHASPNPSDEHSAAVQQQTASSTRVPSLVETVMRSAHKSPHLSEMASYIPDELSHLRTLCDRAALQKDQGGLVCSQCRRTIVTPALEWIEWREIRSFSESTRFGRAGKYRLVPISVRRDEINVPFIHRACSLRCGPQEQHAGWEFPEGTRGRTIGNIFYTGPLPSEEGTPSDS
ncbi:unnamed protein product [Clonostachys rosea f. rosea IK726]|uniref:Uncharacterized protein n=2 Tax=Bionectria ochroleuca TaxID=29856 RepID=A0A0B7K213_BIOOC|nr:unnamed protein product [Clonostachys rosea f. rosea IK726]